MSSGTVRARMDPSPPNLAILLLPIFIQRNPTMAVPHHIFLHRNARAEVAGFKATWEVIERVRKYYVFVLA